MRVSLNCTWHCKTKENCCNGADSFYASSGINVRCIKILGNTLLFIIYFNLIKIM